MVNQSHPSHKLTIQGEEPLSPPSTPQPTSKRHQRASATFAHITQEFALSREPTFLSLLNKIQSRLTELHEGTDEEYRQQIAVLEDERDRELLGVEAARGFALERIEREYEEEKRLADKEYQVLPPSYIFNCRLVKNVEKMNCYLFSADDYPVSNPIISFSIKHTTQLL
jgi:hypothetical protein